MRIGFVTANLYGGGRERALSQLAGALAAAGQDVFVYCMRDPGPVGRQLVEGGVHVRRLRSGAVHAAAGLCRWVWRDSVEILAAHAPEPAGMAALAGCAHRIPVVQTVFESLAGAPDAPAPTIRRVNIGAETLRTGLPARWRSRAEFVPPGTNCPGCTREEGLALAARLSGRKIDGPLIVQVGSIAEPRDPLTLVEAFSTVQQRYPDARLILAGAVGDAAYERLVRSAIRALDLQNAVTLAGFVVDAWRLTAAADVYCRISRSDDTPLSVLEAFSLGVPVVATNVGGLGRVARLGLVRYGTCPAGLIEHGVTGVLVAPQEVTALATGIVELLDKPSLRGALAQRARSEYEAHYTTAQYAARYMKGLEQLLAEARTRTATGAGGRVQEAMRAIGFGRPAPGSRPISAKMRLRRMLTVIGGELRTGRRLLADYMEERQKKSARRRGV